MLNVSKRVIISFNLHVILCVGIIIIHFYMDEETDP